MIFNILSSAKHLAWPAVPTLKGALLLAMQYQLELSQWLPAEKIKEKQLEQLREILRHAKNTVPLYSERLRGIDTDSSSWQLQWQMIPHLTREDLQTRRNELLSTAIPKSHGPLNDHVTSGSTGKPVSIVGTSVTRLFWKAFALRHHIWFKRDFDQKYAAIKWFSGSRGKGSRPNWGDAVEDVLSTGPCVGLDVRTPVPDQASWLAQENPAYLQTYPSNLEALARHFRSENKSLPGLREIRTFGELLHPEVRRACSQVFNVPIVDIYSSEELGYMAIQCPENPCYHLQAESLYVEILRPDGTACSPGETGKLVLTSLINYAMPLIRYEIGDYAEVGHNCPCGRGLPVINRIFGRERNMFYSPIGEPYWPSLDYATSEEMAELMIVRQIQVVQKSLSAIEIIVACYEPLTIEKQALLKKVVLRGLTHDYDAQVKEVEAIPIGPRGKFEDFRCEIPTSTA